MMTRTRTARRATTRTGLAFGAAAALTLLTSGVASAHVTAQPGTAVQGGHATVAFTVPTESERAGTVKFQLTLPTDHPIPEVLTAPMPGWTERTTKTPVNPPIVSDGEKVTEVVRTITWTAQPGTRVGPGQFATFNVSMGPLPATDQLVMPAIQTYDDGHTVNWDQPRAPDGQEPEHPAPTLTLVAGSSTDTAPRPAASAPGTTTSDTTARWLGGAGVLLGAIGLLVGLSRRRPGRGVTLNSYHPSSDEESRSPARAMRHSRH